LHIAAFVKNTGTIVTVESIIRYRTIWFTHDKESMHIAFRFYVEQALPCVSNFWKVVDDRSKKTLSSTLTKCDEALVLYWLKKHSYEWAEMLLENGKSLEDEGFHSDDLTFDMDRSCIDEDYLPPSDDENDPQSANNDSLDQVFREMIREKSLKVVEKMEELDEYFKKSQKTTRIDSDQGITTFFRFAELVEAMRSHHNNVLAESEYMNHIKALIENRDDVPRSKKSKTSKKGPSFPDIDGFDVDKIVSL
jgi:hypothetical protein